MPTDELKLRLKEEALRKHLDDVRSEIAMWISQLDAPSPFGCVKDGTWGWSEVYLPDSEKDSDKNTVLRRHLKSRALWRHHAEWLYELDAAFASARSIRAQAAGMLPQLALKGGRAREAAMGYLGSALEAAFDRARGVTARREYRPDDQRGVRYGAYIIDALATGRKVKAVEKRHADLINSLSVLPATLPGNPGMKEFANVWRRIKELEASMQALASRSLKTSDILYPCSMCRHLWA